ncbi:MAG TPA: ATP-binding protein, partial [Candidatus Acidoferrales bacterium]|nr:ATP-binding protein [Candidatus Acidoferrales bacterium]
KGAVSVRLGEVNLGDLVRQIDTETRELQEGTGLNFVWDVPQDLPLLSTDPLKVRVVLKNLIGNAVKFTKQGTVSIRARTCAGGVELCVADTGIGMSPEVLSIIFEAFRQGDSSFTRQHEGVGLGLYIVRRMLDLLGGTIRVESLPDQGSTFYVWLPAFPAEQINTAA